ncbi:hypothetical protein Q7C36_023478 [Tachysurus vachellii]|uniref:Secreted protein n=1 Tax=Tachysurus vachellii TaxID=175792 RepID=A0AA88IYQ3_TACVA|nr:hypothetical protein Q7C36_023478 [Tachysurus vachellii]
MMKVLAGQSLLVLLPESRASSSCCSSSQASSTTVATAIKESRESESQISCHENCEESAERTFRHAAIRDSPSPNGHYGVTLPSPFDSTVPNFSAS